MNRRANVPVVIILSVLILISLSLAGGGFYLLQKERAKTQDLEQKLEELSAKQRVTETKLKESERLISDLQVKLQDAKSQIGTLSNDLQQEKAGRIEAQALIEQIRADLAQQKGLRSDLEKKLSEAQNDLQKTIDRLKQVAVQKDGLESKVKELESKTKEVELGNIVVGPETAAPKPEVKKPESKKPKVKKPKVKKPEAKKPEAIQPAPEKKELNVMAQGLEGKVLVINKDYNFAVINLGSKDGVGLGDAFSIYHNDKYVGDVKVEKVHDSMSAAGFVSEDIKDKVNEGDKVVQKVK